MRFFNSISGGIYSTVMALLFPKVPCVIVNTGGNYPSAWETIHQLKNKGIKIIVLSSPNKEFPTYYEYIKAENLKPFYKSCSDKAKQRHLNNFFKIVGPAYINIGITKEEKKRIENFKNKNWAIYCFPMLKYTREQCEKILRTNGVTAHKTGCWFCGKQPRTSWLELKENYPELFNEAIRREWLPEKMIYITTSQKPPHSDMNRKNGKLFKNNITESRGKKRIHDGASECL